jgi:hypothetical protein
VRLSWWFPAYEAVAWRIGSGSGCHMLGLIIILHVAFTPPSSISNASSHRSRKIDVRCHDVPDIACILCLWQFYTFSYVTHPSSPSTWPHRADPTAGFPASIIARTGRDVVQWSHGGEAVCTRAARRATPTRGRATRLRQL